MCKSSEGFFRGQKYDLEKLDAPQSPRTETEMDPNFCDAYNYYFDDKSNIDIFDKVFRRKSDAKIKLGSRVVKRKIAVDYFTKNNINRVLNNIM